MKMIRWHMIKLSRSKINEKKERINEKRIKKQYAKIKGILFFF